MHFGDFIKYHKSPSINEGDSDIINLLIEEAKSVKITSADKNWIVDHLSHKRQGKRSLTSYNTTNNIISILPKGNVIMVSFDRAFEELVFFIVSYCDENEKSVNYQYKNGNIILTIQEEQ